MSTPCNFVCSQENSKQMILQAIISSRALAVIEQAGRQVDESR